MFAINKMLDGTNDEEELEPVPESETPDLTDGEPLVGDLVLGERATIAGSDDAETLAGTEADERIEAGDGDDTVICGGGDDQILAGAGNDVVTGSGTIFGEEGNDTLSATAEGWILAGGASDDFLNAAGGNTLYGGADADLFGVGSDADYTAVRTIADFVLGVDRFAFDIADGEIVTGVETAASEGEEDVQLVTVAFAWADGSGDSRVELV